MMKKLVLMSMVVLMVNCAFGAWVDDFEGEVHNASLSSPPWEDVAAIYANGTGGYGGSGGIAGPSTWATGSAYRPIDAGDNVVEAKLIDTSGQNYSRASIAIETDKVGTAKAIARLYDFNEAGVSRLECAVTDADEEIRFGPPYDVFLTEDVWYTVRIEVLATTIDFKYKQSDSATWINLGELNKVSDWGGANYARVQASRNGYIDDVSSTPEPATMLLLGLGGLLIRRKK